VALPVEVFRQQNVARTQSLDRAVTYLDVDGALEREYGISARRVMPVAAAPAVLAWAT
jgi:hypothetical protein